MSNKNEKEKEPARKELGKMLFKHYFKALSNCDSEIAEIKGSIVKQEEQEKEYNISKSECFKQKDANSLQGKSLPRILRQNKYVTKRKNS